MNVFLYLLELAFCHKGDDECVDFSSYLISLVSLSAILQPSQYLLYMSIRLAVLTSQGVTICRHLFMHCLPGMVHRSTPLNTCSHRSMVERHKQPALESTFTTVAIQNEEGNWKLMIHQNTVHFYSCIEAMHKVSNKPKWFKSWYNLGK